jgi:hypothetical protein
MAAQHAHMTPRRLPSPCRRRSNYPSLCPHIRCNWRLATSRAMPTSLRKSHYTAVCFSGCGSFASRTPSDYYEYLSTWVEYNGFGFWVELSTTGGIVLNSTQLKQRCTKKTWIKLKYFCFSRPGSLTLNIDEIPTHLCPRVGISSMTQECRYETWWNTYSLGISDSWIPSNFQ